MLHMDNPSLINKVNELQGVSTKPLKMFYLHELYIDGIAVAYIRSIDEKLMKVITFIKFASTAGANYTVSLEELGEMIDGYRISNCFMYKLSKSLYAR